MSWRPIVSTWRKPRVVTSAVGAPLPSRIMLVATVVPWSTRPIAAAAPPARASARVTPVMKACDGSSGVLGVLARQTRPPPASRRAISVNVPPMSMATTRPSDEDIGTAARPPSDEGIDIAVAVEGAGDRKSTRLNSSHANISYAVFCLKKKHNQYVYAHLHIHRQV